MVATRRREQLERSSIPPPRSSRTGQPLVNAPSAAAPTINLSLIGVNIVGQPSAVLNHGAVNWVTPVPPKMILNASPTQQSTTSTTSVMMGFGAGSTPTVFTPILTGKVKITVVGVADTATAVKAFTYALRYGTGTAPANGASPSGTVIAGPYSSVESTTVGTAPPSSIVTVVSGLALGTQVWLDFSGNTANASDAFQLTNMFFIEEETP
jgi:hypothetical protein